MQQSWPGIMKALSLRTSRRLACFAVQVSTGTAWFFPLSMRVLLGNFLLLCCRLTTLRFATFYKSEAPGARNPPTSPLSSFL